MSIFTGIATGFLGAAIKDKEAKDNLRMKIAESAGIDYLTKDKPEHEKREKAIKTEFDQVVSLLDGSTDGANWFAENGWITGNGNAVNNIINFAKQKNLNLNTFKDLDWQGTNYDERKIARNQTLEEKGKKIEELTGGNFGGIGINTAKNQLEGFGGNETTEIPQPVDFGTVKEGEGAAVKDQKVLTSSTPITQMFSSVVDERGVEAKYNQVVKAIEEQNGYADTMTIGADGSANFTWGPKRKIAAAHAQFATMLLDKDKSLDQNTAASAAERYLVFYTEKPFKELENITELKGSKYVPGDGIPSVYTGARNIDVNSVQYGGVSIKDFILNKIDNLPTTKGGEINEAIFQKFVENVPNQLMDGDISFRDSLLAQRQTQNLENNYFSLNN